MKNLLLFICLLFTLQNTMAQNWCPPGATWYPGVYSSLWGYDAIVEYKYTHDTLIQNKNCKIIKGTFIGQNAPEYGTLTHTFVPNYRTYYTYENSGVIYLYQDNIFDTVVNFNASIGDKWKVLRCPSGSSNSSYVVTDTGHVVVGNLNLKKVTASYSISIIIDSVVQTFTLTNVFNERILGSIVSWTDLFGRDCFYVQPAGEAFGWPQTCGYKDDEISTIPTNSGVCRLTGIQENSSEAFGVKIYPNPNNGKFKLELPSSAKIFVYNAIGELVYENNLKDPGNFNIEIAGLTPGIYCLKAKFKGSSSFQKIIIE